jgi:hypothetical protein
MFISLPGPSQAMMLGYMSWNIYPVSLARPTISAPRLWHRDANVLLSLNSNACGSKAYPIYEWSGTVNSYPTSSATSS